MRLKLLLLSAVCAISFTAQADVPRPEHPRPQFQRESWINLNGQWTFTFDFGKSGIDRKLWESKGFDRNITVPFCPESKLSGVQHTDFINALWYHRKIQIPNNWAGMNILLHFGGVDYYSAIYVDGKIVGQHWGGMSPFEIDITQYVTSGSTHDLVLYVEDDLRSEMQGGGKQSRNFYSQGCDYTRTTGVWQTVWMEAVNPAGIKRAYIVPELDQNRFVVYPEFLSLQSGQKLKVDVVDGGKTVYTTTVPAASPSVVLLPLKTVKTWSPESPFLYDLQFEVLDAQGKVIDKVSSYAGMRKIHIENNRLYLNNKLCYLRLVLDQGFYPTGIWTAPTDNDLKRDIELSMQAGFNGACLHQKVFEERFHYWADKLGYLTWGESSSWGLKTSDQTAARNFLIEWKNIIMRDRNHPSIIAWTPFNETGERPANPYRAQQHDRFLRDAYEICHALEYRPVNDASGYCHVVTDLWTVHNYEQDPVKLKETLSLKDGKVWRNIPNKEIEYGGQPYFVDEYGGIKWIVGTQFAQNSWGYGEGPKTIEEFMKRLADLTDAILSVEHIAGYCYTQLTDIEQEQNGIYNYDRTSKFDMAKVKAIFEKVPDAYKGK